MTVMETVSSTRSAARRFTSDCSGATAIEYAVVAVLIGAALVTVVGVLGGTVAALYERIASAFTS